MAAGQEPRPGDPLPFLPGWMDSTVSAQLPCAALRWVDSSFDVLHYLREMPQRERAEATAVMYSTVTRRNTLIMHCPHSKWPQPGPGRGRQMVLVRSELAAVGRTSFRLRFTLSSSAGRALGEVHTTSVCIDPADLSRTQRLPHAELLRRCCSDAPGPEALPPCEPPAEAHVWQGTVRRTDCDNLGHVNNAQYALLAEEARASAAAAAAAAGRKAESARLRRPVRFLDIEYLGQPVAGDRLEVLVWEEAGRDRTRYLFRSEGAVAARCASEAFGAPAPRM
eukprot:TRINITY_DN60153_c0_g1_i1.p1 TRINITY_DN60153_c0_g1~~TRINITY_DN60153_c0_g1_i1.p1  ORF type:complete len:280 (+),score=73.73 TRINITY_DN60153_c0_g1_i1:87-926(+)